MAIYHLNMHSNKVGSSAVAHAAYISGSQLYSDRTGTTHDYSQKEKIVCQTLLFPEGVEPISREELWNTIEAKIKDEGRNYGKTGDFAIPLEWLDTMKDEEIVAIAAEFLTENFVKKGHAVDFAFHKKDGNPHIDYFVPQWKFNEEGQLVPPKIKSVFANKLDEETGKYIYDETLPVYNRKDPSTHEYRFPVIDPATGEQKVRVRKGGREKIWYRVDTEDSTLNNKEFLLELRKSWQDIANKHLAPEHKIDCRSLEAQGITDREPDIHISSTVLAMEAKNPGSTEKMKKHNEIKERNSLKAELKEALKTIQGDINDIFNRVHTFTKETFSKALRSLTQPPEPKHDWQKAWNEYQKKNPTKPQKETKTWTPPKNKNNDIDPEL